MNIKGSEQGARLGPNFFKDAMRAPFWKFRT